MDSKARRLRFAIAIAAVWLSPSLASAASPAPSPQPAVGMIVRDTAGAQVGTIEQVSGNMAIVTTGKHKVSLPMSSFAMDKQGPLIAMTRDQLDAAAEKAEAQSKAAFRARLVPGVLVKGLSGVNIGTIKQVDDDFVVLTSAKGDAKLPVNAFTDSSDGLKISMTAADFEAAVAQGQ